MRLRFFLFICIVFIGGSTAVSLSVRQMSIQATSHTEKITTREKMIQQLIGSSVFLGLTDQSLSITIDDTLVEPRGRMKGRSITLSSLVQKDSEFLKLFVHEFGHFFDIYILHSQGGKDISSDFYSISWQGVTTKKAGEKQQNFVSGYAATNQYEDFAESFVFYIFHNRKFEDMALKNESVRQKYLFFQSYVFPSGSFVDTDFSLGKVPTYTWDTTKLPISLQKYLYSLN